MENSNFSAKKMYLCAENNDTHPVRIANPLYDHAFKYLMSNNKLAKKVISVILDKEIKSLELQQQEFVIEDTAKNFTLYRLDFKAKIINDFGVEEMVLIELQKSKLPTNLKRFRTYLGHAYMAQKKVLHPQTGMDEDQILPIISIYILGYNVDDIPYLATKIDRKVINTSTNEEVEIQSDFVDLLTHTTYILQVRRLPHNRRSKIEKFMTLFNQAWIQEEGFILDLEEIPEDYADIANYLSNSLKNEDVRQKLLVEQEIEDLFAAQEATKARLEDQVRIEFEQKSLALQEKDKALQEKNAALLEKDAALKEKNEAITKMVNILTQLGKSDAEISNITGLKSEQIEKIRKL